MRELHTAFVTAGMGASVTESKQMPLSTISSRVLFTEAKSDVVLNTCPEGQPHVISGAVPEVAAQQLHSGVLEASTSAVS